MPPKKNEKKDKKEDKKKTSKKASKKVEKKTATKAVKKSSKKESKKASKKEANKTTTKEVKKSSKKEVKKTTTKQILKPVKKIEIKKPKGKKISKESDDDSDESESEDSSKEKSIYSESENEDDDYEITDTKMTEFFSDDNESQTYEESEMTEYKTEVDSSTLDSSDPKEKIYNDLINTMNKDKNTPNKQESFVVVPNDKRLTNPRMTKYEMVRLIGERTKQLTMLAKPLVKNIDDLTYEEIAILELRKNVIPFKIKRPLPNNTLEVWDIEELYKDHLEF